MGDGLNPSSSKLTFARISQISRNVSTARRHRTLEKATELSRELFFIFVDLTKTLSFIIILSPCKIFPAWWLATGSNRKYKWIQFASCNTATGRLSPLAFPLDAFLAGNSWNSPNFSRPSSDFSASSRGISPCLWNEYRIYKECNFFVYSYCVV